VENDRRISAQPAAGKSANGRDAGENSIPHIQPWLDREAVRITQKDPTTAFLGAGSRQFQHPLGSDLVTIADGWESSYVNPRIGKIHQHEAETTRRFLFMG